MDFCTELYNHRQIKFCKNGRGDVFGCKCCKYCDESMHRTGFTTALFVCMQMPKKKTEMIRADGNETPFLFHLIQRSLYRLVIMYTFHCPASPYHQRHVTSSSQIIATKIEKFDYFQYKNISILIDRSQYHEDAKYQCSTSPHWKQLQPVIGLTVCSSSQNRSMSLCWKAIGMHVFYPNWHRMRSEIPNNNNKKKKKQAASLVFECS